MGGEADDDSLQVVQAPGDVSKLGGDLVHHPELAHSAKDLQALCDVGTHDYLP
jgi:hypothetical protein